MPIPEATLSGDEGEIPAGVAVLSEEAEAPETQPPLISFRRYNERECEIEMGQVNHYALDALKTIKGMGTHSSYAPNSRHIVNVGEYTKLYRSLDDIPDVSIQEVRLEGKIKHPNGKKEILNKGRIFYFRADNTISIVAIRASHYNTDKGRG